MRMIVSWDGSGHAVRAFEQVLALFRERAVEHVEIVLKIWPPTDTARWTDIRERQATVDDLHRAAAEIAAEENGRLQRLLAPFARSVASDVINGDFGDGMAHAIARVRPDVLFIAIGPHDPNGDVSSAIASVVHRATVPALILHAPD